MLKLVFSLVLIDTFLKSKIRKLSQNVVSQFKWNFDKEAFSDLREWAFFLPVILVVMLQEGEPLLGPESGLLSYTQRQTAQDTH